MDNWKNKKLDSFVRRELYTKIIIIFSILIAGALILINSSSYKEKEINGIVLVPLDTGNSFYKKGDKIVLDVFSSITNQKAYKINILSTQKLLEAQAR